MLRAWARIDETARDVLFVAGEVEQGSVRAERKRLAIGRGCGLPDETALKAPRPSAGARPRRRGAGLSAD
jgi:hypothetical protein